MQYRFSVAEMWHRVYLIEAKSPQKAFLKYKQFAYGNGSEDDISILDPEYIDDMSEGHIMWDDKDIEVYYQ